jgi:mono/diheme cytochrome c family protein/plastocyanin
MVIDRLSMRREVLALILIIFLLSAAIGIPAVGSWQRSQGTVIHAHMAETGGWKPENLIVAVGEPLHLRLTSDDVTHGFAVGQSDQPAVEVNPGEMTDVTLVFDQAGKYTFYCTRWCSVNHWRMRGTIEVTGLAAAMETDKPPLYVTLGLDIDAAHHADVIPTQKPSARRGALLNQSLSPVYLSREYYLTHAPLELWQALRGEQVFQKLSGQDIWDLVAWVWQSNTTSQLLSEGQHLFVANCAACHGEQGGGNGVFADQLAQSGTESDSEMQMGQKTTRPADFTDPYHMLAASPAHLQGKIIRGGMGTSMPYWGPIFTEDQTWALVAYLWKFQFEMEVKP